MTRTPSSLARQTKGASFIIGLVLFLICAMVAAVVVMAASANAQRAEAVQRQQQSYFSVSSAAQLLANDMQTAKPRLEGTVTTRTYECPYTHEDEGTVAQALSLVLDTPDDAAPSPLMQMIAEANERFEATPADGTPFVKEFSVATDVESDEVSGLFKMSPYSAGDGAFDIVIELRASESAMTLTIPAAAPVESSTNTPLDPCIHEDVWNWLQDDYLLNAESQEGWAQEHRTPFNEATGSFDPTSNEFGYATPSTYEVGETCDSVTIRWGTPTISKGEVAL